MNLRSSLVLCSVLICGIVTCSATEEEVRKQTHECIGQYLKSKGKIEYEVTPDKRSSMCLSIVDQQIARLHGLFEDKMKMELPNDSACLVDEFDKSEIVNVVIKAAFYLTDDKLSEDEKKALYPTVEKEGDDELAKVSMKCGVDPVKVDEYMNDIFGKKEFSSESETTEEVMD